MAEQNPPAWMDGTTIPGEDLRRMTAALATPGVVGANDLKVTEHAGTPNMSVDVAAGAAFVAGTSATWQGTYHVESRASVTKTIAAADATNARKDIVVARVREDFYDSSGVDAWDISVVTGTPAGSPTAPATPANCLLLAVIDVPANDTAIGNAQITDSRIRSGQAGAAIQKITFTPGGNTDYTSGSLGDWITVGNLSVPSWAGRVRLSVHLSSVFGNAGLTVATHRLKVGTATGTETGPCNYDANVRGHRTLEDLITLNATGTQSLVIQCKRATGSVEIRADASTVVIAIAEYLPA